MACTAHSGQQLVNVRLTATLAGLSHPDRRGRWTSRVTAAGLERRRAHRVD